MYSLKIYGTAFFQKKKSDFLCVHKCLLSLICIIFNLINVWHNVFMIKNIKIREKYFLKLVYNHSPWPESLVEWRGVVSLVSCTLCCVCSSLLTPVHDTQAIAYTSKGYLGWTTKSVSTIRRSTNIWTDWTDSMIKTQLALFSFFLFLKVIKAINRWKTFEYKHQ